MSTQTIVGQFSIHGAFLWYFYIIISTPHIDRVEEFVRYGASSAVLAMFCIMAASVCLFICRVLKHPQNRHMHLNKVLVATGCTSSVTFVIVLVLCAKWALEIVAVARPILWLPLGILFLVGVLTLVRTSWYLFLLYLYRH